MDCNYLHDPCDGANEGKISYNVKMADTDNQITTSQDTSMKKNDLSTSVKNKTHLGSTEKITEDEGMLSHS